MSPRLRLRPRIAPPLLLFGALVHGLATGAEPGPEVLAPPGRAPISGQLQTTADGGLVFQPASGGAPLPVEPGMVVTRTPKTAEPGVGQSPFSVDLGIGQRLSGKLVRLNDREIVLNDGAARGSITIARAGAASLSQRPGETLVLQDGFESIESSRWTAAGEPALASEPRRLGAQSLRLPASGAALTHQIAEPFTAGRCSVAFHESGETASGHKNTLELTFRTLNGPETVRVVLGWADGSLAVESPGGPALAVQRLARSPGWHLLTVRFGSDRIEVGVDGNELAHGKGVAGPLVELKLATSKIGRVDSPSGLAAIWDDLTLVRLSEPSTDLELDATQDEIRLISGDQLYGSVTGADGEALSAVLNGQTLRVTWAEATGVYFRRTAAPGAVLSGHQIRAEWQVGPGNDPADRDRIEGVIAELTVADLRIATPYAGTLTIPRDRLTRLEVLGRGTRLVVDPKAHHLGDEVSVMAPILDPPQPEGGVLERTFELPRIGEAEIQLVLDVVQVAGEGIDLPFAMLVKKGELRTNVAINGNPFDYLNRLIPDRNESPRRIRLPIPRDQLRPGKNVIRFELVGIANDPNYLDDLGILGIAIESPALLKP